MACCSLWLGARRLVFSLYHILHHPTSIDGCRIGWDPSISYRHCCTPQPVSISSNRCCGIYVIVETDRFPVRQSYETHKGLRAKLRPSHRCCRVYERGRTRREPLPFSQPYQLGTRRREQNMVCAPCRPAPLHLVWRSQVGKHGSRHFEFDRATASENHCYSFRCDVP